jgi:membrane protease YdiL (CAAX protease family)
VALTILWVVLMAPLSVAGTVLQPHTAIPYEAFPLVMIGPALAALICKLAVPAWFPEATAPVAPRRHLVSLTATLIAGIVFTIAALILFVGGPAQVPSGWNPVTAVLGIVVGLAVGSLLEEIGYRGVMYRALATRVSPLIAILVNGVFFGLCHLQYFGAGVLSVLLFVLSTVFMDVVMVALWTGSTTQRVIVASTFHAIVNIALALIGDPQTTLRAFVALAVATGVAALVALVLAKPLGLGDLFTARNRDVSVPVDAT